MSTSSPSFINDESKPKWKREEIPDHKFHFVNISEYEKPGAYYKLAYMSVFALTFQSILIYLADFSTALFVALYDKWAMSPDIVKANSILDQDFANVFVKAAKGIYLASIAISYFLLFLDFRKSVKIIRSADISFAFTDSIAYRFYSIRSYGHWCFFNEISSHHRFSDSLSLFVFFRLQGWKRLLFAETPRQLVNVVLLIAAIDNMRTPTSPPFFPFVFSINFLKSTHIALLVMFFMVATYAVMVLTSAISFLMYIPLVFRIQGNFKEYICHMIDKRISELMKKKSWKRIQQNQGLGWEGPQPELPSLYAMDVPVQPSPIHPNRRMQWD